MKYLFILLSFFLLSCSHGKSDFEITDHCETEFPFEMSDVQMYVPEHEGGLFREQLVYRVTLNNDSCTTKEYVIRSRKEIDDFNYQYDSYQSQTYSLYRRRDSEKNSYYHFDMSQFSKFDSIVVVSQFQYPEKLLVKAFNGDIYTKVVLRGIGKDNW